jgi:hypothetical protein
LNNKKLAELLEVELLRSLKWQQFHHLSVAASRTHQQLQSQAFSASTVSALPHSRLLAVHGQESIGTGNSLAKKLQQTSARKTAAASKGVRRAVQTAVAQTTGKHKLPTPRGEAALR